MAFKTRIRKSLVSAGANEILSYTFVPGKLLENAGQHTEDAFKLSNALSPELEYYRLSLMPSLLEKVHPNLKAGYSQFALFELGKGHNLKHADDNDGLPTEFEMLDVVIAASDNSKTKGTGYFQAKLYLDTLADDFGLSLHYEPMSQASDFPVAQPYEPSRSAVVTDTLTGSPFGIIGEFTSAVGKAFKLPRYAAGFSISPVHLLNSAKQEQNSYRPLPRFPKITQDMTLKVVADLGAQKLTQFLSEAVTKAQPKNSASEINITDIFQKEDEQTHKQITVRLEIASFDRTLTDKEVNALLGVVANSAHDNFGADRI